MKSLPERVRIFGIRHHGPGSSRRLLSALDEFEPNLVLVEAPADAQAAISLLNEPELELPVALVLYQEKNIERASFLPFTDFSPEFQAMRWAHRHAARLELIDLPAKHYLAEDEQQEQLQLFGQPSEKNPEDALHRRLRRDPLSLLAQLAGYPDSECWWDATLERGLGNQDVFEVLSELMVDLRRSYPSSLDRETSIRESYMRISLRKAIKNESGRIAVVVGAWHIPALSQLKNYTAKSDRERLRKLPRTRIATAWVPWSYPRLSRESGYGAGLQSPAWYELLFHHPDTAVERWMVAAAQLLRQHQFAAGPARAADGLNLARSLAALRRLEIPGLQELQQAALSTLAQGSTERLELIEHELSQGKRVGKLPPSAKTVPLLADLHKQLKSTRLAKYWAISGQHYVRATKSQNRGGLDLRMSNQLKASHLLHRLNLLGLPWGTTQALGPLSKGSFKEIWLLEWQPEYNLILLERGGYGNTIATAAQAYTLERAEQLNNLSAMAQLVLDGLRAGLPELVPKLLQPLRKRALRTQATLSLLQSLPPLVVSCRYGDSRKTDTSALLLLIQEMVPRIVANLPSASSHIDDEQAAVLEKAIRQANLALGQLDQQELLNQWRDGLQRLSAHAAAHDLCLGLAWRLLYDAGRVHQTELEAAFRRAVSRSRAPTMVADWLEGFLHTNAQLLLHQAELLTLIDEWIADLRTTDFEETLPALRRTFSLFAPADRQQLLSRIGNPDSTPDSIRTEYTQTTELEQHQQSLLTAIKGWLGEQ